MKTSREYYQADRERINERSRNYYYAHREQTLKRAKARNKRRGHNKAPAPAFKPFVIDYSREPTEFYERAKWRIKNGLSLKHLTEAEKDTFFRMLHGKIAERKEEVKKKKAAEAEQVLSRPLDSV